MSSERRIAASRANGKKSRGPVTPQGKARSALNAKRHGLASAQSLPPLACDPQVAARAVCLTNERPEEFIALHASLVAEHAPATTTENLIVEEMAIARWRLNRALQMETALLDFEMDEMTPSLEKEYESIDETLRAALAFRQLTEASPALTVLHRYESRLSRQFDRCLKRLTALRVSQREPIEPVEPNPKNGHSENDHQLPSGPNQPEAPAQPLQDADPGPTVAPAPGPPQMARIHLVAGPQDNEPGAPNAPSVPRSA